ncbi:MAG: ABC transporter permease [Fibrobacteria bacterium]|nr:ABC transporter permease [Fibrobacteria bacterium]
MTSKTLLVLAWRNVWRSPLRSAILISSVALGLWLGVFVIAFYQGMNEQRLRGGIERIGHLQIHSPGFREEYDASLPIPSVEESSRGIASTPGVGVAVRTVARGMLSTVRSGDGVEIRGVDSASESQVSRLRTKIVEGEFFGGSYRRPVVVGRKLADRRGLSTGTKIVLTFQDSAGDMVSGAFRVSGIFQTSDMRFDEGTVFVPRAQVNSLLGIGDSSGNEIALRLERPEELEMEAERLRRRFPGLEILTWKQLSPDLELSEASSSQVLYVFMVIIMLGLAFGIVNTMLMAVLERTREIGTLMALGMRRGRIFAMVLAETVVLVLVGAPAGMSLAALTIAWSGTTGIDLSRFGEGLGQFGMSSLVYPRLDPIAYLQVLALVAVTAVLASIPPARKALALQPTEAIRSL